MPFMRELCVRRVGPDRWVLLGPLIYRCEGKVIFVPAGFTTDFASVPRLPLAYLLAGNTGHRAAVVHDFLYGTQMVSRSDADRIFRKALIEDGEPRWRAWVMWTAVRMFGGMVWDRYYEQRSGA